MATKKCKHDAVTITWHPETGKELASRCSPTFGCGAQLAYGRSNDKPAEVRIEIRAARLIDRNGKIGKISMKEWEGVIRAAIMREPAPHHIAEGMPKAAIGWLAYEIATHQEQLDLPAVPLAPASAERPPAAQWPPTGRYCIEHGTTDCDARHDDDDSVSTPLDTPGPEMAASVDVTSSIVATPPAAQAPRRPSAQAPASSFDPWPAGEPPQYNGSGEPCDAWIGACCCGATHLASERERPASGVKHAAADSQPIDAVESDPAGGEA